MERLLSDPAFHALIGRHGRSSVKKGLTSVLSGMREGGTPFSVEDALGGVEASLTRSKTERLPLRRVLNGTGILIHTNLGRSPVDEAVWDRAGELVCGYSNLEFDLDRGERGSRDEHVAGVARELFGCEAALLVNNNAAATLLLLAAVAAKREVLVSRGELVEIGGSFRIPEVIEQGGARLREVGTTNRTRAEDYDDAVTRKTAAILRVNRSNFEIVGFTESPSGEELVSVARRRHIPLLIDEGSGHVIDLSTYGLRKTQTVGDWLALGADAVTCSTDKLIGATQGGLILGSSEIVERCRRHPLMRALRAGKESYALVTATLEAFLTGTHETRIPIYRMLSATLEDLRQRAHRFEILKNMVVVPTLSAMGGGTTPTETVDSIALSFAGAPDEVAARLLRASTPVVGRIHDDRFTLDLRTILPEEDELLLQILGAV